MIDTNSLKPVQYQKCPASGHEIGFIVPSKVPLNEAYNSHVPPGSRYSFKQLGLVIDLTNTTRYYSTTDLKKEGIKTICNGGLQHGLTVFRLNQFVLNLKHSKKYILVHCTHGHNRTGFMMIVHYLMRSGPMNVTQENQGNTLNGGPYLRFIHDGTEETKPYNYTHQLIFVPFHRRRRAARVSKLSNSKRYSGSYGLTPVSE
ncbi:hypothetical protein Bca52824_018547 [Brassica carinata]|uniref:Tyrosine specific protein phosphatases domain-containing protein n=1 Tax=Brassica carinata TaxID=52824 RepID=A0A8X7VQB3_BRACI|nr:hypothetical protein Bca52824_018547 [Brassica carinata]